MKYEIEFSGISPHDTVKLRPETFTGIHSAHPGVGKTALWAPLAAATLAAGAKLMNHERYGQLASYDSFGAFDRPTRIVIRELEAENPETLTLSGKPGAAAAFTEDWPATGRIKAMVEGIDIWSADEATSITEATLSAQDRQTVNRYLKTLAPYCTDTNGAVIARDGSSTSLTNATDATRAAVYYAALSAAAAENETIILDHPERYLQASALHALADIMVNLSETKNVSWIYETNSPHLTSRLQTHVAEGRVNADDTCMLYVMPPDAPSRVHQVLIDYNGQIEDWPEPAFSADVDESFRLWNALRAETESVS